MQYTDNFGLKVYEGTDLFNPLTVENDNVETIDGQLYANQTSAVQTANELYSGGIHAITRSVADAPVFRFTAVSNYTAGETFTVDEVSVEAFLTSGERLPSNAFVIGAEVIGILKGTRLTVIVSAATVATAENANNLGTKPAAYYGTKEAVDAAQNSATEAGNLATQAQIAVSDLSQRVDNLIQSGVRSGITIAGNTFEDIEVAFAKAFDHTPTVVASLYSTSTAAGVGRVSVSAINVSARGFTCRIFNGDTVARAPGFNWIAV